MSARSIAEERAGLEGKVINSFKSVGRGAVRSLELNNISEGETVTIPLDYKIFQVPIAGSTNFGYKVITEEGKDLWVGVFTRGAAPADGSAYVRPSGTVVEAIQRYADMDKAFKECLAGKSITYTKKTPVVAKAFDNNEDTRTVSVWQIDFAEPQSGDTQDGEEVESEEA